MDNQATEIHGDNIKRLCGLNMARELNFTDEQYERAIKQIDKFDNSNQLLVALLAVSNTDDGCGTAEKKDRTYDVDTTKPNTYESLNKPIQSKTKLVPTNSCETTSTSSSLISMNTPARNGLGSSENQSLECLDGQHPARYHIYNTQQLNNSQHRQRLQRSRSHQPTTSVIGHATNMGELRPIYIDGSNVARTHGKRNNFSWPGIKLCVDWFRQRNHKVKVFVPTDKCQPSFSDPPDKVQTVDYLNRIDALIETPLGCNDDMFVIEAARHRNGVIVSNDLFRDEKRSNSELRKFIDLNRLSYVFDDDLFIPDPLGGHRRTLDDFLRVDVVQVGQLSQQMHKQSLYRTKSHQRQ